ncbi:LOW QUALITY PROTEIN: CKLF-like MARVEL transmembrane domain-containing protein 6 [Scomber scombrus]|uniref:LOW QUALITY PROTEIN: CKLF-like MARVEL transmembrane domain-containing protein 6 n=1 Tax=Scomber scombrus TaxID=13677 RepID=UPI002DD99B07|nr:LOW QUALITY PROTEIN: CKLF-like MARVEL transmembrane domain-containing protein 6 [Scomber scombrus]
MTEVYSPTTVSNPKSSIFLVPTDHLDMIRFIIKVLEVVLSLVAFIQEEVVPTCTSCSALYFFEFVSCTAFLFTLLLLVLLSTPLHKRVGIDCWPKLDCLYTGIIAVFFLISSIVFASDNSGTSLEKSAVAFGFMATVAFFVDFGLMVKKNGLPFKRGGKSEPSNGAPPTAAPETEKLNTPNGAESV